jgi:hypothetical protein
METKQEGGFALWQPIFMITSPVLWGDSTFTSGKINPVQTAALVPLNGVITLNVPLPLNHVTLGIATWILEDAKHIQTVAEYNFLIIYSHLSLDYGNDICTNVIRCT